MLHNHKNLQASNPNLIKSAHQNYPIESLLSSLGCVCKDDPATWVHEHEFKNRGDRNKHDPSQKLQESRVK